MVGFDDLAFTRWSGPPMTTVRQPLLQMGSAAADLILAEASGRRPDPDRIELATTLVVRDSTAPPRRTAVARRVDTRRATVEGQDAVQV